MTAKKICFAIFGVVMLLAFSFPILPAQAAPLEVVKVKGDVEILKSGNSNWVPAEKGMALSEGDKVRTGEKGKLELKRDETKLTLYKDSNFHVKEWDHDESKMEAKLDLSLGKLKAKVKKLNTGDNFEIVTPTSTAAVRGTTFIVWVFESMGQLFTQLDVLDDVVEFSDLSQQESQLVNQGDQLIMGAGGFTTPDALPDPGAQDNAAPQDISSISEAVGNTGGFDQSTPGSQMNASGSPVQPEQEQQSVFLDG